MNKFLWFTAGAITGVAATYRYISKTYSQIAAEEVNEAQKHYRQKYLDQIKADLATEKAADKLIHEGAVEAAVALTNYQGLTATEKPKATRPAIHPGAKAPYVIGVDEYMNTEVGYDQVSLTYYEGDDVVVDITDTIVTINRVEETIGRDNLTRFGELSEDDNVVYIRCEKFNMDFEVTRSMGKYSVEVQGESE
jgi:hypothetical protein